MPSFSVPDFYPDFHCKGGSCRHNCCLGWPVTVSLNDYFRLLGLDCSPELRRKLDVALHVLPHPVPERYAEIAHNWEGLCPLLQPDGLCRLHAECGEASLSATCRYHPRGIRTAFNNQATVSASCEALIELLLERQAPLTLIRQELAFDLPLPPPALTGDAADAAVRTRDEAIILLTDRTRTLAQRLIHFVWPDLEHKAARRLDRHAAEQLALVRAMTEATLLSTASMEELSTRALAALPADPDQYEAFNAQITAHFPFLDLLLEHLLVNHLIFTGYPLDPDAPNEHDQRLVLLAIHDLLLYHLVALQPENQEQVIDLCADCFRVFEHSAFTSTIVSWINDTGKDAPSAFGADSL